MIGGLQLTEAKRHKLELQNMPYSKEKTQAGIDRASMIKEMHESMPSNQNKKEVRDILTWIYTEVLHITTADVDQDGL